MKLDISNVTIIFNVASKPAEFTTNICLGLKCFICFLSQGLTRKPVGGFMQSCRGVKKMASSCLIYQTFTFTSQINSPHPGKYLPELPSFMEYYTRHHAHIIHMRMSSAHACHLHVVRMRTLSTRHLHVHVICTSSTDAHHLHIICACAHVIHVMFCKHFVQAHVH